MWWHMAHILAYSKIVLPICWHMAHMGTRRAIWHHMVAYANICAICNHIAHMPPYAPILATICIHMDPTSQGGPFIAHFRVVSGTG